MYIGDRNVGTVPYALATALARWYASSVRSSRLDGLFTDWNSGEAASGIVIGGTCRTVVAMVSVVRG